MNDDNRPIKRIFSRREALALLGIGGSALLAGCSATASSATRTTTAPAANAAPTPSTGSGQDAAAATSNITRATTVSAVPLVVGDQQPGTNLAGQMLVKIPANPSFSFTSALGTGAGTGESSPIATDYWLGQYQVTNAQYKAFLVATDRSTAPKYWSNSSYPSGKDDHPVLFVSAEDAQAFCDWSSSTTDGWKFRLPTEAEWENAARGPQGYAYPWGNQAESSYAAGSLSSMFNYNGVCAAYYLSTAGTRLATYNNKKSTRYGQSDPIAAILSISADGGTQGWIDHSTWTGFVYTDVFTELSATGGFTMAVGSYKDGASYYGCYEMAGNAFEWTSSLITATNGAEAGHQVNAVRGGSWYATSRSCRTSYRGEGRNSSGGYNTVGFRVAAVQG